MVDGYTGKRIDIIAWSYQEDEKQKNPLVEKHPLDEDKESDIFQPAQTQKSSQKQGDNKEKELEVGDDIVVVGKFIESQ